jgi:2-hydroxychromene-2-carboxylate isomerase
MSSSMESSAAEGVPIKLYFDYKSPFAFLAMLLAFELPERYRVSVRWIPYVLRIKGTGERSVRAAAAGQLTATGVERRQQMPICGRNVRDNLYVLQATS